MRSIYLIELAIPLRGVGLVLLSACLFPVMDAIAKHLGAEHHVAQIVWARYVFHVLVVAALPLRLQVMRYAKTRRPPCSPPSATRRSSSAPRSAISGSVTVPTSGPIIGAATIVVCGLSPAYRKTRGTGDSEQASV